MESERLKQGFQGEIIEKLEEENLVALTVKSPFFGGNANSKQDI